MDIGRVVDMIAEKVLDTDLEEVDVAGMVPKPNQPFDLCTSTIALLEASELIEVQMNPVVRCRNRSFLLPQVPYSGVVD